MRADHTLHQTFVEHEHLAPDTEQARTAFYLHLRQRRRRRTHQSLAALTAAVAAAAVTVAGIQVRGAPPAADRATAGRGTPTAQGTTRPPHPRPPGPLPLPTTLTLGAGWLPGATTEVVDANGFGRQQRGFLLKGGGPHSYVLITAEPGGLTSPYGGAPHDLLINGKQAREYRQTGVYYIAVRVAPGRILSVYVGDNAGAEQLAVIGRRVAENLRLDRHDTVTLPFALTYLPAGTGARGFERDTVAGNTTLRIGPPGLRQDIDAPFTVMEAVTGDDAILPPSPKHGRPIQGHPTRYASTSDTTYLWVDGFLGQHSVLITGRPGTLAELYKIADGLRRA
ncbi:MAG: hypothetical protein V7637_6159 [Mycobacteriales bacterium]